MKKMIAIISILFLTLILQLSTISVQAETWGYFASLIKQSDYFAQYQKIERDNKTIGFRLVRVYWKDDKFNEGLLGNLAKNKPFSLKDYDRKKDELITIFVFYGRGQHLWTVSPKNGVIFYPGITTHRNPGEEIACSSIEFHNILLEAGKLKKEGKEIKGNLLLTVFGKKEKAK